MSMEDINLFCGAVASNARAGVFDNSEPITLESLSAMAAKLACMFPPPLIPNPCDVGPETYKGLRRLCSEYPPPSMIPPHIASLNGITIHSRAGLVEGVFHHCTCNEKEEISDEFSGNPQSD